MPQLLTAFPAEYDKDIQTKIHTGIGAYFAMAAWKLYFNITNEKSMTLKTTGYSGFDAVPQWYDGTDLPMDEAEKIWDMTLTMLFYGLGFKVTRIHQEYGQSRLISGCADSLVLSVEQTYGNVHVATLDNAFTTSISALGTTLISNSHTTAGAGTRDNRGAGAAFGSSGLAALRLLAANWTNYRGINQPIDLTGAKLIYPSDLDETATKLVGSANEPGTANNDLNVVRTKKYVPVEEPRLTTTTAYFLQARRHGLLSNHGVFPRPIRYQENNGNLVHGVEFHCVTGVEFADGMFGDPGA